MTTLIFWTIFAQKVRFQTKTEKVNPTIEFCIFELVWIPNFSLNWKFYFFGPSWPKWGNSGQKQKSEHHNWILHIQIRLGIKFQHKLTIFIFWPNLPKMGICGRKRKNRTCAYVHGRYLLLGTSVTWPKAVFSKILI